MACFGRGIPRRQFLKAVAIAGAGAALGGCVAGGNSGSASSEEPSEGVEQEAESSASDIVASNSKAYDGAFPEHDLIGKGVGVMPGRVVWEYGPDAVSWDGTGFWWRNENFDAALLRSMVGNAIATLAGAIRPWPTRSRP